MRNVPRSIVTVALTVALSAFVTGCKQEVAASSRTTAASSKVAKIVFIGKRNACNCTRKRVDDSLAALKTALENRPGLSIEKLQADEDQESVARYKKQHPIMVLPAIYFLEGSGALVDVLQGEVTAEQISTILQAKKSVQ